MANGERFRPTAEQLKAARGKGVRDLIGPDLRVLFVGINPGLYSAAIGHHFGRPGSRFWPALHLGGFTPRQLLPFDERELLPLGYGITNIVRRATAMADELKRQELVAGGLRLRAKVRRYRPRIVAVLGIGAYRAAFGANEARMGRQAGPLEGAVAWVLPNPSGLNAHYPLPELARMFRELRAASSAL